MIANLPTLPTKWELKKLGDVVIEISSKLQAQQCQDLPYLSLENIESQTGKLLNVSTAKESNVIGTCSKFTKDTVIYSKLRPYLNKVAIPDFDGVGTTELIVFQPKDNLDKIFLANFLRSESVVSIINANSYGAKMPRTSSKFLKELEIPLPPLDEQKRLVSLLDTLFAKIDRSIELTSENITAADALLPSALNTVFGELGEKWETKKLGDIATVGTGVTPLKSKHEYYENGTINWITSKATNNDFVLEAEQKISEVATKECRLKIYTKGTLIVALYGQGKTRGQVSELMIHSTINQAIAAISVYKENSTSFIKYFFKKSYLELRDKASGGTQDNLNLSIIKSIEIPLPPLHIQTQTVAYLDSIRDKVEILKRVQNDKIANLKALKASILDRAFKGEL